MPECFVPENAAARDKFCYIPFALGPRVCTGMAFALTEAVLCLAALAQRLALRLQPCTVVEPVARLTLRPRGPADDHSPAAGGERLSLRRRRVPSRNQRVGGLAAGSAMIRRRWGPSTR